MRAPLPSLLFFAALLALPVAADGAGDVARGGERETEPVPVL